MRYLCFLLLLLLVSCSESDTNPTPPLTTPDLAPDTSPEEMGCADALPRCYDVNTQLVCDASGALVERPCETGLRCDEATGSCLTQLCTPGALEQCTDAGLMRYCNPSGTGHVEAPCPGGALCERGRCAQAQCDDSAVRCLDNSQLQICNAAGVFVPGALCAPGTECFEGACVPLCELNAKISSYIGCEYWSVDLDNYDDALSQPHAIVVSNPNPTLTARVWLYAGFSDQPLTRDAQGGLFPTEIPPGEAVIFSVPVGFDHSGTRHLQNKALRLTSNIPTIAYQFNPLNNVDVYSNDGTLLIPTNATGRTYWGMSWPHRGGTTRIHGFLTIVNSSREPNRVTITPSAQVVSGPNIPTINAGEVRVFDLEPGDSLNLETSGVEFQQAQQTGCLQPVEGTPPNTSPCPDLTGTRIDAELPITVFGGHQCGNVLLGINRCDHLESILFPTDTWGTDYVGSKFSPRATTAEPEPDVWRVIASQDNTRIQTDPPIEGIHNATLNAGQWRQFEAKTHFRLGATAPIMLAQYMVGSNWLGIPRICNQGIDAGNPTGIGDPAMTLAVPTRQFRKDYVVLAPQRYAQDYLNIVAPTGATILLNGQPIAPVQFQPVGSQGAYVQATVQVNAGFHKLVGNAPFGVISYGYDCHVSYAYPGGLNLEAIVPTPVAP